MRTASNKKIIKMDSNNNQTTTTMDFNIYARMRLFLSIIFLAFQLITLPHFVIHKEYRQSTCFRLMFAIGLCESYQMLIMGLGPLLKFAGIWTELIEKVSGALNEGTLDVLFLLILVLALNRLCVMFKMNVLKEFGDGQLGWEKRLYWFLYCLCALFFVLVTALFASPFCGLYLDAEFVVWNYNYNLTWSSPVQTVEFYGYMVLPTFSFVVYCTIVIIMRVGSSKMLSESSSVVTMQRAREYRILLQSMLQFLIFIIPVVYGFLGVEPGKTALDNYGITSVTTIVTCGINPILYLILLPQLRGQVLASLRIKKTTSVIPSTVILPQRTPVTLVRTSLAQYH